MGFINDFLFGKNPIPSSAKIDSSYAKANAGIEDWEKIQQKGLDLQDPNSAVNLARVNQIQDSYEDSSANFNRMLSRQNAQAGGSGGNMNAILANMEQNQNRMTDASVGAVNKYLSNADARGLNIQTTGMTNASQIVQQGLDSDMHRQSEENNRRMRFLNLAGQAGMMAAGVPPMGMQLKKGGYIDMYQTGALVEDEPEGSWLSKALGSLAGGASGAWENITTAPEEGEDYSKLGKGVGILSTLALELSNPGTIEGMRKANEMRKMFEVYEEDEVPDEETEVPEEVPTEVPDGAQAGAQAGGIEDYSKLLNQPSGMPIQPHQDFRQKGGLIKYMMGGGYTKFPMRMGGMTVE